jgi:hypothetical protein
MSIPDNTEIRTFSPNSVEPIQMNSFILFLSSGDSKAVFGCSFVFLFVVVGEHFPKD